MKRIKLPIEIRVGKKYLWKEMKTCFLLECYDINEEGFYIEILATGKCYCISSIYALDKDYFKFNINFYSLSEDEETLEMI